MCECDYQCSCKIGMCNGDLPPCAVEAVEAATKAAKEKVTSTISSMVPCPTCGAACSIGGDDEEETHYYIPVVPFRAQGQ